MYEIQTDVVIVGEARQAYLPLWQQKRRSGESPDHRKR